MAVCKRCGCAMPIGSKVCDICGPLGGPAPQVWVPPTDVLPAAQLAGSAAAWAIPAGGRPQSAEDAPKGGFWMRVLAYIIDGLIIALPSIALGSVVLHADKPGQAGINFLIELTYFVYFWSSYGKGQTIGMQLLHMKVVKTDGSLLSVTGALLRFVGLIIASIPFCLGLIWVGIDAKKQGWHDKIAGSYVVSNW
jgi:uncharacterized RDD family membrane protein YckC